MNEIYAVENNPVTLRHVAIGDFIYNRTTHRLLLKTGVCSFVEIQDHLHRTSCLFNESDLCNDELLTTDVQLKVFTKDLIKTSTYF